MDWGELLRTARFQGVAPLFLSSLERLGLAGRIPPGARRLLEEEVRRSAVAQGLLARELRSVLDLLAGAAIPALPLKGPALAVRLYGDPTLRTSTDLDLLVPRERAEEVLDLLARSGYRSELASRFFRRLYLEHRIECALRREGPLSPVLEVHWGVLWKRSLDRGATEDLWAEARDRPFLGAPALAMSPEWELLFLAGHAARHRFRGLRWLVDLHDLCASTALDWERLEAKAARFGWSRVLALALGAARALFGTEVPPRLAHRPTRLDPFAALHGARAGPSEALLFLPAWSDRLRQLLAGLLLPTLAERSLLPLPRPLEPLYYLLRPLRLLFKWGPREAGRLLRR